MTITNTITITITITITVTITITIAIILTKTITVTITKIITLAITITNSLAVVSTVSLTVEVGFLEEEDGADGPSGGQGNEQDRPVAASGPQPEEPEMMLEDNEGEECFEDDEVQFVSETGAGQTSTSFSQ